MVDQPTKEQSEDTLVFRKIDEMSQIKQSQSLYMSPLQQPKMYRKTSKKKLKHLIKQFKLTKKDFKAAKKHFETCLKANKNDKTIQVYIKRLDQLILNPPVASWDGVGGLVFFGSKLVSEHDLLKVLI